MRLIRHYTAAIGIAVVVAPDLMTKRAIEGVLSLAPHSIPVTPFFNLTLCYNRGISFSLFAPDNPSMPYVLAFVSLLIATAFTIWLLRTDNGYAKLGLSNLRRNSQQRIGPAGRWCRNRFPYFQCRDISLAGIQFGGYRDSLRLGYSSGRTWSVPAKKTSLTIEIITIDPRSPLGRGISVRLRPT